MKKIALFAQIVLGMTVSMTAHWAETGDCPQSEQVEVIVENQIVLRCHKTKTIERSFGSTKEYQEWMGQFSGCHNGFLRQHPDLMCVVNTNDDQPDFSYKHKGASL